MAAPEVRLRAGLAALLGGCAVLALLPLLTRLSVPAVALLTLGSAVALAVPVSWRLLPPSAVPRDRSSTSSSRGRT
jgi:hypothetical protein